MPSLRSEQAKGSVRWGSDIQSREVLDQINEGQFQFVFLSETVSDKGVVVVAWSEAALMWEWLLWHPQLRFEGLGTRLYYYYYYY